MGEEPSAQRALVYADDLEDIPQNLLSKAFERARKEYEYPKLPPVAFIRRMAGASTEADGRPGPEEAWARMPKGERVEDDSVVWCEEERVAYGACRSLLLEGDQIGARMAFKERYEKEVAEARSIGKPVHWTMSAGYNMEHRLATLVNAVQERRLSLNGALNFVPEERRNEFAQMLPSKDAKGLLTGETTKLPVLPGLPGILSKMRMEGIVPDQLKSTSRPSRVRPSEIDPEEYRRRREELKAQVEFLKRSRNGSNTGAA